MAIRVQCPKCKLPQEVSDNAAGKVAECVGCKAKFPVPGKKVCHKCGKDVSHAKRSKDQFGRYYCAECIRLVATHSADGGTAVVPPPPAVEQAPQPAQPAAHASKPPAAPEQLPEDAAPEPLELMPVEQHVTEPIATPAAHRRPPAPAYETPPSLPAAAQPKPQPSPPPPPAPAGVQVVFRALKSIQWPKRCIGCFAENPTETTALNVLRATKMGKGKGLVGAMVRGLTGRMGVKAKGETARFDLPVCADCCAKLLPEHVSALSGKDDASLPPLLRVESPLLAREIEQQCVILTFYNEDFAAAFKETNPGLVFDTVPDCLSASAEEAVEPTVPPAEAHAAPPAAPAPASARPPEELPAQPAPAAAPAPAPAAPPMNLAPGDILAYLARTHLPAGEVRALGVAYWNVAGAGAGALGAKAFLGNLFGGKKPETEEKQHQAGLLAVVGDKLAVVELGMVTGEAFALDALKSLGPARVKNVPLKGLKAGYSDSAAGTVLHIYGEVDLAATFPPSCGADNPGKAAGIAKAIMRG